MHSVQANIQATTGNNFASRSGASSSMSNLPDSTKSRKSLRPKEKAILIHIIKIEMGENFS